MKALAHALTALLLGLLLAVPGQAQDRLGIILMHGKQGSARDARSGLPSIASALQDTGDLTIVPLMPWSSGGWESIKTTVDQAFDLIDGYAAQFEKENPGVKVKPVYSGTYQESIVKFLTAHKAGTVSGLAAEVGARGGTTFEIRCDRAGGSTFAPVADLLRVLDASPQVVAGHSAGAAIRRAKFLDIDDDLIAKTFDLNVKGTLYGMQAVLPHFKDRGTGQIVNISSIYGVMQPRFEVYAGTAMTMPVEF